MNALKSMSPVLAAALGCVILANASCRRQDKGQSETSAPSLVVAPELKVNGIGSLPGAIYRNQADSRIHWQPWSKDTFKRAKAAGRLVFCVIAIPQQPSFMKPLAALEANPSVVDMIHSEYVPVLVDGDASREIGLLTADLCAEINCPLDLPLIVWMTHEGNPVAWIPAGSSDADSIVQRFLQSHSMVSGMWKDDAKLTAEKGVPGYVLKNSAMDNANRRARLEQRKIAGSMSEQPAVDVVRSIRQLASLYDPYSHSFDESGGLFPASSIELLSDTSVRPGPPADVRARAAETSRGLLDDLLPSAIFDPLDGGVFASRHGTGWSLPGFIRDAPSQARVAVALIEGFRATGDRRALDAALGVISFAEKSFSTAEGLFAVGLIPDIDPSKWMWSVEDVEKELGPEEAAWWIKATGMKGLGNLPSEIDPQREYFRLNTLGLVKPVAGIAADLGLSPEAFLPRFEAAKAKLLAARDLRFGKRFRDDSSHAGASFRMVSAYAAAFVATGSEEYREKAVGLLNRSREAFASGPLLRNFPVDAPAPVGAGRAFLYALAIESVLDVEAITLNPQWLVWAEDLATTAAENFTGNGFLKECPDDAKLIDLPITDLVMLFGDSTAGLVSLAECRLAALKRPLVQDFSELATAMPSYAMDRPILHTDLLLATLMRHFPMTVVYGPELSPEMKTAVERLPLRGVHRRVAGPEDQVPAGSVKVLLSGKAIVAATPAALQQALLPSAPES